MKTYKKILASLVTGCLLMVMTGPIVAQDSNTSALIEKARKAGIQEAVLTELQNKAQGQGISPEHLSQILEAALEMSAQDLPAEMAINKALEGISKGVPSGRIVPAVHQVQQSMSQAARVVDPWVQKPGVQQMINREGSGMSSEQFRTEMARAVSTSFIQNVPADAVNQVLSQIDSESVLSNTNPANVVVAMGILSDLPTTGDQPDVSAKFIVRALKRGFNADQLQKLPSALEMGQQRSQLPAASVVNQVASQMQDGIPAKQILQNLFNGNIGGGPPGDLPKGIDNKPDNNGRGNGNSNRGGGR